MLYILDTLWLHTFIEETFPPAATEAENTLRSISLQGYRSDRVQKCISCCAGFVRILPLAEIAEVEYYSLSSLRYIICL